MASFPLFPAPTANPATKGAVNPYAPRPGLLGQLFGWKDNPLYQSFGANRNLLLGLSAGALSGDMGNIPLYAQQGRAADDAAAEKYRTAQMRDEYAKTISGWGDDFAPLAEAVAAGAVEPGDAWRQGMQMQAESKARAEELQAARQNAVFINDPELRALVENGALPFRDAYDMDMKGEGAPSIVEIFDEQTGMPQKGYMRGDEFIPLGGTKAPSNGTSLSFDPETGGFTFNQGGTAPGIAADPTRNQGELGKKLSAADAEALKAYREAAVTADDLGATIDGLEMTLGNVGYTGPGGELYGTLDDVIGILPGDKGARGASRSLGMEAQLAMTAKTKGAITDREMGMFKQAVPSLEQTAEGNQQIVAAMRAMTSRVKTRAAFMEEYVNAKGSLNGAQAAWRHYIEAHPVLVAAQGGGFQVQPEADFYPYLPGGGAGAASAGGGGDYPEGTVAQNPQTGERVILRNGQWVPL